MPQIFSTDDSDFEERFATVLTQKREDSPDVDTSVGEIIADVRARGDAALIELTERYDRFTLPADRLAFTESEIEAEIAKVPGEQADALRLAADRIRAYHERQLPTDENWVDESGVQLGWRWSAVAAAGLYVPGGTASYPSSLLMNAIPARVAGVERLVVTAPTPDGIVNPLVLMAARIAGVDRVYRVGGAQAIAALAYGTETIAPVAKIVGPGNAYVAAAKRRVFGRVGIDMIAGPSEILVIADRDADPDWIALDLLSQAEHDAAAQAILITTDRAVAEAVIESVEAHLAELPRREIAEASWRDFGAVIRVNDLGEAAALADVIAPEHLELCVAEPEPLADNITNAGAMFLGHWTPEAIGDYVGGPGGGGGGGGGAGGGGGGGGMDFLKRTSVARMTPEALKAVGPAAETLARAERLTAHGLCVRARLDRLNE